MLLVAGWVLGWGVTRAAESATRRVPQDFPGIQAAIDAAQSGDLVLVSPGTYAGGLVISGKIITLASLHINSNDPDHITQTIIEGGGPILAIQASAGPGTTVRGLTFRNGGYQLVNYARGVSILNNRFIDGGDQVSFESAGGLVRDCVFESAGDDGIDADEASDPTIERNTILGAGDDGIEVRLQSFSGPACQIVIRDNVITGCGEDGIQLIDYAGATSRTFRIEGNVLANNAMAGLGCMANGNTNENFAGAPLVEEVRVIGNTFSGNPHGLTGGDNMLVMNNIFVGAAQVGVKRVAASSLVTHNDFWSNGIDYTGSNVQAGTTWNQNPLLDASYLLMAGSPCIDAGAVSVVWNGNVVSAPPYSGSAPDLGARETFGSVSVADGSRASELALTGVHPNPPRAGFAVAFTLPDASPARIEIVDAMGRRVLGRELGDVGAGTHHVSIPESRSLPAGTYLVRVVQGGRSRAAVCSVIR